MILGCKNAQEVKDYWSTLFGVTPKTVLPYFGVSYLTKNLLGSQNSFVNYIPLNKDLNNGVYLSGTLADAFFFGEVQVNLSMNADVVNHATLKMSLSQLKELNFDFDYYDFEQKPLFNFNTNYPSLSEPTRYKNTPFFLTPETSDSFLIGEGGTITWTTDLAGRMHFKLEILFKGYRVYLS